VNLASPRQWPFILILRLLNLLALIEMIDQIDPALGQRLVGNPVEVGAQSSADQSEKRSLPHDSLSTPIR